MQAQLVLENVGVRLPNRVLFESVNWSLYEGMRVALAGRNGSGKSTLLKILARQAEPTEGECIVVGGRNLRLGFLDQSLLDSAVVDIKKKQEMGLSPVAYLVRRLQAGKEADDFDLAEAEWETRKTLSGLGFSKEWMEGPLGNLSGGWLLRVFIAAALVEKPEVLLLDEPTNHLDLSSIQWLEEFLQKEYRGSLLLVTHDVSLQKRTTDSLAVLHGGRFFFRPNQRDYLTFRESLGEEKRLVEKQIESTERKIAENMDFVLRFRAKAQTAARAQSKLKAAETLKEEMVQLKDRLQRIEGFSYNLKFRFRHGGASGKFPMALTHVNFRYPGEDAPWVLKDISLDIARGQRVAILGDNGAGKTTLLNVLAERLKPSQGEVLMGHNVLMGYFGQHQLDELSLEDSVMDNLRSRAVGVSYEELRGWLGAFGFLGEDDIAKKTRVLSGGERARLALLRILVTRINVCLLDEPTNHLDVETKELLKEAMRAFEGTTIFVSHDREFVSEIAERILYLSSDHTLIDHLGNLDSFFEKYPHLVRHLEGKSTPSQAPQRLESSEANKPKISYEERKKFRNQARSLEKKISSAEAEIERLGAEKAQATERLSKGGLNPDEAQSLTEKLAGLDKRIHALLGDWEKWGTELETIRQTVPDLA